MSQTQAGRILTANEELLEKGNPSAAAEFFAPSYVVHVTGKDHRGHRFIKSFCKDLRKSFPDLRVEVDILVGKGDRVAWQRTWRATHQADFKGFPATGRAIVWRDLIVSRFEGGLIAEEWAISDLAERLLLARRPR
jgi:predicted ester cyclase